MKIVSVLYQSKIKILLLVVSISTCVTAVAQEYKYEIGGMAGMSMYMGDANKNDFFRGWSPSFGGVFRRNFNFRWALKADLLMGRVTGDTRNTDNVFPDHEQISFSRNFYEMGGQMEFNFLPYSDKFAYLQTRRISPYILAGLGFSYAPGDDQSFFSLNIPLGIGVKYKFKNRINFGLEYSFRKSFADDLDAPAKAYFNLDDPYRIKSSWTKNKDWYSLFLFSVTWDFGPNDRHCTNLE